MAGWSGSKTQGSGIGAQKASRRKADVFWFATGWSSGSFKAFLRNSHLLTLENYNIIDILSFLFSSWLKSLSLNTATPASGHWTLHIVHSSRKFEAICERFQVLICSSLLDLFFNTAGVSGMTMLKHLVDETTAVENEIFAGSERLRRCKETWNWPRGGSWRRKPEKKSQAEHPEWVFLDQKLGLVNSYVE